MLCKDASLFCCQSFCKNHERFFKNFYEVSRKVLSAFCKTSMNFFGMFSVVWFWLSNHLRERVGLPSADACRVSGPARLLLQWVERGLQTSFLHASGLQMEKCLNFFIVKFQIFAEKCLHFTCKICDFYGRIPGAPPQAVLISSGRTCRAGSCSWRVLPARCPGGKGRRGTPSTRRGCPMRFGGCGTRGRKPLWLWPRRTA